MKTRMLGKTGKLVSEIGLGTWQLGSKWGEEFNDKEAELILETAYENGINIIDTADIYNNGDSERAIGRFLKNKIDDIYVVTKCGRGLDPHTDDMYTPKAIEGFIDSSLKRLQLEKLDMILLHCPPTSVYKKDSIFTQLDNLKNIGKIDGYGVSIEKVEEGIQAMEYDIDVIEVIYNMFRLKPSEKLFVETKKNNIGVIARVPLASGLLTGKYSKDTRFGVNDHRRFNRNGEIFDKGETFSGVDYELGLKAVEELKRLFGTDDLIPYAIRWILMNDAITTVIPGASKANQVKYNVKTTNVQLLTENEMQQVEEIYKKYIKKYVHNLW